MIEPSQTQLRLLYLTAEQWPTFRPDVVALFGKYLPRSGINSDLVTERDHAVTSSANTKWAGGQEILCNVPQNRAGQYLVKLWHNLCTLVTLDSEKYDAIQVRDMSLTALAGLVVARIKGIQFFYWLSYPQSEGQISRAKARGLKGGMRFLFPLVQGLFGQWLLYKIVLPRADHVFVQSSQMQIDIARHGIPMAHMTPVPMGVDTEVLHPDGIQPIEDARLTGKRVVVYLGTLDPLRKIEILLQMLAHVRETIPDIFLVLVGDTSDVAHLDWLKQEAGRLGIADLIVWTGWLTPSVAWRYVISSEVGLSPIPRGYMLDMGSPTKAVEYMALGLPVLVNDSPDQAQVVADSGAGLCVQLDPRTFAESLSRLLSNNELCHQMGDAGQRYVSRTRAYHSMARTVAAKYRTLLSEAQS